MAQLNRATLARVLDVLGSEHAGEALAAAKLATAMVHDAGFTWDDVLRSELPAKQGLLAAPSFAESPSPAAPGLGPMGMRRERDLSPYEQFFMLLLSPRTPSHVKKELRGWETRVLDGEITPQETQDLRQLFKQFVA
ncbi:hypothetical protein [Reyranella sp. CPCC 100927]|uniref:hypothetical protein n=1 Tax=Reyranella sp. CPCC 100927 TaxID=2599616 RepID=UPI0011B4365A|nr:hypothetical protein [Reyranella sp. CPCC 100927]TWT12787.1 hypothetical protein FQU96_11075 [Reyranella sp. CPCC 100927]